MENKDLQELLKENMCLKNIINKGGLIWKDYPEDNETKNYAITLNKELSLLAEESADNKIIEGDNLLALRGLQKTHRNKIDVIYIDPPYNTGSDFIYDDKRVSSDGYSHSKWLSFMDKRLRLAKNLMTDDGVIFVSIDDNEQAQLKLLMDEIFGEHNFLTNIVWQNNKKGRQIDGNFAGTKEYLLVYKKNNYEVNPLKEYVELNNYNKDDLGYYEKGVVLYNTNSIFNIDTRPNLAYTIYIHPEKDDLQTDRKIDSNKQLILNKELLNKGYIAITPPYRTKVGKVGCWRWSKEKLLKEWKSEIILDKKVDGTYMLHTKSRLKDNYKELKPKDFLDFHGYNGSQILEDILGGKYFSHPKNVDLLKWILDRHSKKDALILDFFAGSGTTGHAVMELNKEDGGNRSFILCTNNEVSEEKVRQHFIEKGLLDKNNKTAFNKFKEVNPELVEEFYQSNGYKQLGIARSVTRERIKRVSEGYTTPKGVEVEGLGGGFEYYIIK